MGIALGIAIYIICWWVVLFTMLPIGVRTQDEAGEAVPGTPGSAPMRPMLLPKLVATSLIAGVIVAGLYAVMEYKLFTLVDIPFLPRYDSHADG